MLMLAAAVLLLARVARGATVSMDFGGWGAPFGVTFVADRLSAALCTVAGVVALAVAVFARADIRARRRRAGFDPLFLGMLAAVNGAFLTGDIFNLYVWFELMLVTALGLVTLDRRRAQIDGAFRYAAMSMMGATFMLRGHRPPLRRGGDARHGAPVGHARRPRAIGDPQRCGVPPAGGARAQGGAVSAVLLAAGILSHGTDHACPRRSPGC